MWLGTYKNRNGLKKNGGRLSNEVIGVSVVYIHVWRRIGLSGVRMRRKRERGACSFHTRENIFLEFLIFDFYPFVW